MSVSDETERLAWVALETVNEAQAKGSTVRFVVSRDPEVAAEKLGMDPDGVQIQAVEEYLLERGYLPPARAGHTRGSYTITPVGFDWLNEGPPTLSEKPEMATDEPGKRRERRRGEEAQEGAE